MLDTGQLSNERDSERLPAVECAIHSDGCDSAGMAG